MCASEDAEEARKRRPSVPLSSADRAPIDLAAPVSFMLAPVPFRRTVASRTTFLRRTASDDTTCSFDRPINSLVFLPTSSLSSFACGTSKLSGLSFPSVSSFDQEIPIRTADHKSADVRLLRFAR